MRSIAARLGSSRNTVAKAISSEGPPTYVRAPQDSGIKAVEPAIRALLLENPRMPATVLAERVAGRGPQRGSGRTWPGSGPSMPRLIQLTGSLTIRVIRRSVICGSRRCGYLSVPARPGCCRSW
jgi:hypothetical protein